MESITDESITDALFGTRDGSPEAIERLVPLVYDALRAIAHRQLRSERTDHTLGTTGLVHEAYIRLVDQTRAEWRDRSHFFSVAARVMRRVLVDYARRRGAAKRCVPDNDFFALGATALAADEQAGMLVALDEALTRLAKLDERQSRVVEYRFFAGLTEEEIGELLGVSSRTVRTDWVKAKGWLYQELRDEYAS